ncbi:hypothetical protein HZR84_12700 [Hyphobacterium sp. CCMP332]|nr:hypothetical protein HZR84_12700 [Hyphobacterium sp. CCMP332]
MRAVISTIASIYLFFNLGFGINQHYCMGLLKDVSFGHESHECCCGESEMMEGCCKDVHVSLSIEHDQIQNHFQSIDPDWKFEKLVFILSDVLFSKNNALEIPQYTGPPPKKSNSRIFIQSLVLYA